MIVISPIIVVVYNICYYLFKFKMIEGRTTKCVFIVFFEILQDVCNPENKLYSYCF